MRMRYFLLAGPKKTRVGCHSTGEILLRGDLVGFCESTEKPSIGFTNTAEVVVELSPEQAAAWLKASKEHYVRITHAIKLLEEPTDKDTEFT